MIARPQRGDGRHGATPPPRHGRGRTRPTPPRGLAAFPLSKGCRQDRTRPDRHLACGASLCPEARPRVVRFLHRPTQRMRHPDRTRLLRHETTLRTRPRGAAAPAPPPPRCQPPAHSKKAPAGNTRAPLLRITGVDLVAVPGLSPAIAPTMLSEIGTDMRKWPDDKPFCSWRGLAPHHAISGGKILKSRTMKTRNRAAQACRRATPSVRRADGALGAFSRRLQGRRGPAQALVATAHHLARTVYHRRKDHVPYSDMGAAESTKRFRERAIRYLPKKAAKLGYTRSLAS
jgi:Transposase IS116/IS110/IS902 family